ncbi:BTAD domain-containing putative transcriptional regulator [Streptomyces sp. NBC_01465]|uniref:BTAD domain-containing putative transcriptional regulator n=1 Tax=Streptomyces sp. NBC_01465 TaxID=2903878 RepID=UPI002E34F3ED|nr:BTAD domain-containing putative transcriptional regulator [Streptomyces sp. NBC_01465]
MRYRILGATEAQDDQGTALPIGGPRLRAALASLALRPGRATTPQDLIDDVWGADPPQDAPAALQALIARLRRTLGKDAITSTPGGYRLEADRTHVDLYDFEDRTRTATTQLQQNQPAEAAETLRTALALWRGPALADLPGTDHAVRPEAQRQAAQRLRIEADLRAGTNPAALLPELTELTTAHPYDEPLQAQLIRALRAAGRPAEALRTYEETRRTLADGLGTDPGPELQALHAQLLEGEPARPTPATPTPNLLTPHPTLRPRLTSFVGREPDIAALRDDLATSRLVTLTGPGGTGKTRLAEEAAAPDRTAHLVELAPLDHPEAVPGAVLNALGLRETTLLTRDSPSPLADDPLAHLVDYCGTRPLLLILDNCEHVIEAAAALAETLLTHCPDLRILATSREPLGVPGELIRPVDPLPPDPAHRLFTERARAVRPDFDPQADPETPAAVAEICRRLDGLPLAIELAAARLRLLTPRQIADRLDDRFRLLTSGARTVLPRQQTLRAVVDWSWDLLDDAERTALRALSVFAGGWDLAAAEALHVTPDDMAALVDKSLLVTTPGPTGMRYRMLETIHEYATERADQHPAALEETRRAHAAYYLSLAEEAEPLIRSGDQLPWIRRLETELDNFRAALRHTISTPDEAGALRFIHALGWFLWLRNYRREGAEWAQRVADLGTDPEDPADPRYWPRLSLRLFLVFLTVESGLRDETVDPENPATLARIKKAYSAGGPEAASFPGLLWPFTLFGNDAPHTAQIHLDSVVANCREYGSEWVLGTALMFRAHVKVDLPGGLEGVDEDLAELRELGARVGDRWMRAQVASATGEAAMARGRTEEARAAYEEGLRLAREVGAHAEAPFLIGRIAQLAYAEGDFDKAEKILDASADEAEQFGVWDARAFISVLRASIALDRGDPAGARAHFEQVHSALTRGTPPPQFRSVVTTLEARLTAREKGPQAGARAMTAAFRISWELKCADQVVANTAENTAAVLAEAGEHRLAARTLSAATGWRTDCPRSVPEETTARTVEEQTRRALGPQGYETERAAGAALAPEELSAELEAGITGSVTGS